MISQGVIEKSLKSTLQEISIGLKGPLRPRVRIPSNCVFYYRCPEHANRYVLSIVFAFDKEEDVYHFAFSYPYSYTRLQKYMESLEAKQLPYFKREKIGETLFVVALIAAAAEFVVVLIAAAAEFVVDAT
ncbi:hypothetical protein TNCV_430081 [Trichonephila clavipes]|nr:hypothetical protein TNCV_430081 [Trichonephila clavipes]